MKRQTSAQTDRGATMVEFALIAIALFTFIFGIIEGSFAVRAKSTITNAVDDAARRGAVAGTNPNADWQIIQQLKERGTFGAANVQYVVVYNGNGSTTEIDPDCQAGQQKKDLCNVYVPTMFDGAEADFGCPSGYGTQWCPKDRLQGGDLSFLGVYIRADYDPVLEQAIASFSFSVDATSMQPIESSGVGVLEDD